MLKVVSKGEECIIKLEDKSTGELYARAFLRKGELHPVEPVIDSSRFRTFQTEILAYIHLIICIKNHTIMRTSNLGVILI